jgi:dihydrofolate reductase
MRVVVINHVTLDGVFQGPGRPDEDTRDGFSRGGWSAPYGDEVMGRKIGQWLGRSDGGLLFGRWTYEQLLSYWNLQGGQFKDALIRAPKFVASTNAETRLDWPNSTLLHGDIPAAIAELRATEPGDLVVMGSGQLIRSLLPHRVIDEFVLFIYPLVLGSGTRLFGQEDHAFKLRLVESTPTTTGVIIARYEPAAETDADE